MKRRRKTERECILEALEGELLDARIEEINDAAMEMHGIGLALREEE